MDRKRRRPKSDGETVRDVVETSKSPAERVVKTEVNPDDLIPTGSTLLNCACSDTPAGGYERGKIVTVPGQSAAGKTILTLTSFAEAAAEKRFADYHLIYDDGEESLAFDIDYMFSPEFRRRIEPPGGYDDEEMPINSKTIQEFKSHIIQRCQNGEKFLYALDSLDSLSTDEELDKEYKKLIAMAKSPEAVKELTGSYNTEKAKILGQTLRIINNAVKKTGSALFIIQQERDVIKSGRSSFIVGDGKTTSGGNAPYFYANHQVWLKKGAAITAKERIIGNHTFLNVKKNKLTGKIRSAPAIIYYDYGMDDITVNLNFLIKEKHWTPIPKHPQTFDAFEFKIKASKQKIVEFIENEGAEKHLQQIVGNVWKEIEDEIRLDRKPKYRQEKS